MKGEKIKMKVISINVETISFGQKEEVVSLYGTPLYTEDTWVEVKYSVETSVGNIERETMIRAEEYEKFNLHQLKEYILKELGLAKENEQVFSLREVSTDQLHEELSKRIGVQEVVVNLGERVKVEVDGPALILINED